MVLVIFFIDDFDGLVVVGDGVMVDLLLDLLFVEIDVFDMLGGLLLLVVIDWFEGVDLVLFGVGCFDW